MPLIITTKRPIIDREREGFGVTATRGTVDVSRRAAATLEEAIDKALVITLPYSLMTPAADDEALQAQCHALTESGGSVGPLPDGMMIDVEADPHSYKLREACPLIFTSDWLRMSDEERCTAYNAAQESRVTE
jgi:hypothetical protein